MKIKSRWYEAQIDKNNAAKQYFHVDKGNKSSFMCILQQFNKPYYHYDGIIHKFLFNQHIQRSQTYQLSNLAILQQFQAKQQQIQEIILLTLQQLGFFHIQFNQHFNFFPQIKKNIGNNAKQANSSHVKLQSQAFFTERRQNISYFWQNFCKKIIENYQQHPMINLTNKTLIFKIQSVFKGAKQHLVPHRSFTTLSTCCILKSKNHDVIC